MYTLRRITRPLPSFKSSLQSAISGAILSHDELVSLLQASSPDEFNMLHDAAAEVTKRVFGNEVSIRGIVEFSNACEKRCTYCGVTAYDDKFLISHDQILECCDYMYRTGYRNLVLQSGEITSERRIDWVCDLLDKIRRKYTFEKDKGLCVVLSIGELSRKQYQRLFDAGAKRYLLRIEASDRKLYEQIHPKDGNHSYDRRIQCLRDLKDIGYVTGTGVMVGLPNQTFDNLANDIRFFRDNKYHMIGLGPYVIHKDTVMGKEILKTTTEKERDECSLRAGMTTLNMYNVLRLQCPYINIAATTALETLKKGYKKLALTGGSNVLMPIITPKQFRYGYQLYEGKKEVDMDREETHNMVLKLLKDIGKKPVFSKWNNPPLFMHKTKQELNN